MWDRSTFSSPEHRVSDLACLESTFLIDMKKSKGPSTHLGPRVKRRRIEIPAGFPRPLHALQNAPVGACLDKSTPSTGFGKRGAKTFLDNYMYYSPLYFLTQATVLTNKYHHYHLPYYTRSPNNIHAHHECIFIEAPSTSYAPRNRHCALTPGIMSPARKSPQSILKSSETPANTALSATKATGTSKRAAPMTAAAV